MRRDRALARDNQSPGLAWLQVETAADLGREKAEGKIGLIMGWQNTRPVADELDRLYFFRRLVVCASCS